jgi:hypothetical protein
MMISKVSASGIRYKITDKSILRLVIPSLTKQVTGVYSRNPFILNNCSKVRFLSTLVATDVAPKEIGKVERSLKALDMAMVRQIKAELIEVDANSDGRQVLISTNLEIPEVFHLHR